MSEPRITAAELRQYLDDRNSVAPVRAVLNRCLPTLEALERARDEAFADGRRFGLQEAYDICENYMHCIGAQAHIKKVKDSL